MSVEEMLSLGHPLAPADIFVAVRRLLDLDDTETIQAFVRGFAAVAAGDDGYLADLDEPDAALAGGVPTRSRITAWRKRARQMTWDELRLFLLGVKHQSESGALDE